MPENADIDQLSYEQAFAELETIVTTLETNQHTLDDTVRLFERGQAIVRHCSALLDQADLKIQQLANGILTPFTSAE